MPHMLGEKEARGRGARKEDYTVTAPPLLVTTPMS